MNSTESRGSAVLAAAGAAVAAAACMVYVAAESGRAWTGAGWVWANPLAADIELATGQQGWAWSRPATVVLVGEAVLLAGVVAAAVSARVRNPGTGRLRRWRQAARRMGALQTEREYERQRRQVAARLAVHGGWPGTYVGRSLVSRSELYADPEALHVDIAGIGRGKTTARVIPAILRAPGAVVSTSLKDDVVKATRAVRAQMGHTWVFDMQGILGEPATSWWNPLRGISTLSDAEELAETLVEASRDPNQPQQRRDPYFDGKGQQLLGYALYAAALRGDPVTELNWWLTNPEDETLSQTFGEHGDRFVVAGLRALHDEPDKTRAGIYSTARGFVSWITNTEITRWVVPGAGREFVPDVFVTTRDTLYLLSRGGTVSAAPLTTALASVVCQAAERFASRQPGQRLNPPLVAVLDELPNVCRWHKLPDQYAHYRSRGINLMAFLQSWSQAVQLWGADRAKVLWDAATCRVYGGGSSDTTFVRMLSDMVGPWDRPVTTRNEVGTGFGSARSTSTRSEPILTVADLVALPPHVMLVALSGYRPTLVTAVPWFGAPTGSRRRREVAPAPTSAVSAGTTGRG